MLEGPYSGPNMNTTITVPGDSPYGDITGINPIPAGVVDWVWLELRNKITNTIIESSRSAFLLYNGKIVDTDGTSAVSFLNATDTQYYIVVKHRNHLGIMSSSLIP